MQSVLMLVRKFTLRSLSNIWSGRNVKHITRWRTASLVHHYKNNMILRGNRISGFSFSPVALALWPRYSPARHPSKQSLPLPLLSNVVLVSIFTRLSPAVWQVPDTPILIELHWHCSTFHWENYMNESHMLYGRFIEREIGHSENQRFPHFKCEYFGIYFANTTLNSFFNLQ